MEVKNISDAVRIGPREKIKAAWIARELRAYSPSDPVVSDVLRRTWTAIAATKAVSALKELHLFVINSASASLPLRKSRYFTKSCQALLDEMAIVVNEQFLYEIEVAVRAFGQSQSLLATQYLRRDTQLFGLIRQIEAAPTETLERLRRHPQDTGAGLEPEEAIRHEVTMVLLFFLAHEVGHLLCRHPSGEFSTFVDPEAPLVTRIEAAVIRMCRHVDQFALYKFSLPGFRTVEEQRSDVRRPARRFKRADQAHVSREEALFQNEAAADNWANQIIGQHLEGLAAADAMGGERSLYLLVRGIFAASLYMWYRDLDAFFRKLGLEVPSAASLQIALMQGRQHYINAASLFGDRHRFTLLRAALAIEAILRTRTKCFDLPPHQLTIHVSYSDTQVATDLQARREWWLAQSVQRYTLLCIAMDTAVKIAYIGCATGWLSEKDRRGAQLLDLNFESIGQSLARLRSFR